MPLTVVARNRMLGVAIGNYYNRVYLVKDSLNQASLDLALSAVNAAVISYGGAKTLIWGTPSNGSVSTTNVATNRAINTIASLTPSTAINFDT